jgi:hypothetical protein
MMSAPTYQGSTPWAAAGTTWKTASREMLVAAQQALPLP